MQSLGTFPVTVLSYRAFFKVSLLASYLTVDGVVVTERSSF